MNAENINIAKNIYRLATEALDRSDVAEAYRLLEMSLTSAFMAGGDAKIQFRLLPPAFLTRPVSSPEHVVVVVSRDGIVIEACAEFITLPLFTFERFPVIGDIFSGISHRVPAEGKFVCIVDLGDGSDVGDYRRVAFCSSRPDAVLIPDPYFYFNDNYDLYRAHVAQHALPWRQRKDVIFWRGRAGGPRVKAPDPGNPGNWDCQQRLRLCAAVRDSAHPAMLDVALVDLETIGEDYLRQSIEAAGFLKPAVDKLQFLDYRYQVDVDGWTNAWSLLDKLISGATVLKIESAFGYRQWFYDKLVPWENYIPVDAEVSGLDQAIEWVLGHPDECERIAGNAMQTARTVQLRPDLDRALADILAILEPCSQSA